MGIVTNYWKWAKQNYLRVGLVMILLAPYGAIGFYFVEEWIARPTYTLSSGSKGGVYAELGRALLPILGVTFGGKINFQVNPSRGSNENVDRIQRGEAQLAFAQDGLDSGPKVRALAHLYSSPLQIVVRKDSNIKKISDFHSSGTGNRVRVFLGQNESGTRSVAELVLKQYGVALSDFDAEGGLDWNFDDAAQALKKGKIDVGFFLVGIRSDAINDLASDGSFTLLDIDKAAGIAVANPYLDSFTIPRGTYASDQSFPDAEIHTVASRELLICSSDMSTKTAYRIVEGLFSHSPELVRQFPVLTQLSMVDPSRNFYYPLHPGASLYYRQESVPPVIPWQYIEGTGGYTVAVGGTLFIWLRRRRLRPLLATLNQIDSSIKQARPRLPEDFSGYLQTIREVERMSIRLYTDGKIRHEEYNSLKEYIRVCLEELQKLKSSSSLSGPSVPGQIGEILMSQNPMLRTD